MNLWLYKNQEKIIIAFALAVLIIGGGITFFFITHKEPELSIIELKENVFGGTGEEAETQPIIENGLSKQSKTATYTAETFGSILTIVQYDEKYPIKIINNTHIELLPVLDNLNKDIPLKIYYQNNSIKYISSFKAKSISDKQVIDFSLIKLNDWEEFHYGENSTIVTYYPNSSGGGGWRIEGSSVPLTTIKGTLSAATAGDLNLTSASDNFRYGSSTINEAAPAFVFKFKINLTTSPIASINNISMIAEGYGMYGSRDFSMYAWNFTNKSYKKMGIHYSASDANLTNVTKTPSDFVNASGDFYVSLYSFLSETPTTDTGIYIDYVAITVDYNETTDTTPPSITLINPSDDYFNDTLALTIFNCSASDTSNVFNISFYLTNLNNQSFSLNATNSSSMPPNKFNVSYNFVNGNYTWNCYSCDTLNNCGFATANRSFRIRPDTTIPSFSNNKTNASSSLYKRRDVQINLTITDNTAVDFYTLSHNDTAGGSWINESLIDISGTPITMVWNYTIDNFFGGGTLGWRVWANDTSGNNNVSDIYYFIVNETARVRNFTKVWTIEAIDKGCMKWGNLSACWDGTSWS